jgi:hypothetical protein
MTDKPADKLPDKLPDKQRYVPAVSGFRFGHVDIACREALRSVTQFPSLRNSSRDCKEKRLKVWVTLAEKQLKIVHRAWREQLENLEKLGWSRLKNTNVANGYSCPYASVLFKSKTCNPCRLTAICPWCWVRQHVFDLSRRLKYELFKTVDSTNGLTSDPADIWDYHTFEYYENGGDNLPQLFDRIRKLKQYYVKREMPENKGFFQLLTLEPPLEIDVPERPEETLWRIHHRVLCLQEPHAPPPPETTKRSTLSGYVKSERQVYLTKSTRKKPVKESHLQKVIGRSCLYPDRLLTGSPADVFAILEYRYRYSQRGFRSVSYNGCLRNELRRHRELQENLTQEDGSD